MKTSVSRKTLCSIKKELVECTKKLEVCKSEYKKIKNSHTEENREKKRELVSESKSYREKISLLTKEYQQIKNYRVERNLSILLISSFILLIIGILGLVISIIWGMAFLQVANEMFIIFRIIIFTGVISLITWYILQWQL